MNSKTLHTVLLALLGVLLLAMAGGTYGANKLLSRQADELKTQKARSQALTQERLSLTKAKKDIEKYRNLNEIAKAVVPQDKNQAAAVREIVNIAAKNGVTLASVTFPASTLGSLPVTGTSPSSQSSASAAGTGSEKLSQLSPVKNIPGVYQLPITIRGDKSFPVRYDRFINFLSDLEHNRRTAQVEAITLQPDTANSDLITFELTLSEYIKP